MHSNSKGEVLSVGEGTSPRCRNVQHSPVVQAIDISEAVLSVPGCRPTDGPLLDAWFELNYRLQEEANDINLDRTFVERWILRLWTIVSPRPQCFWLFLARINELALLCASRYVDCCEFAAAGELLVEPSDVFLRIDGGRTPASEDAGWGREPAPVEMIPVPLLPCLYNLLDGSGYMTENYLLSISYRTYRIKQVARMLLDLGMGNMEQIAVKLSCMDVTQRRDIQSRLCLFDRKAFNEIGRALHLFMRNGHVYDEYVGKYLRG
ncbi:MAG: hypothetical protein PHS17_18610 [Desulfobacterales bacterium]|nr:hypothetical protein [Desulfobacterales bacterium]